jgi:DNA modification methylase
MLLTQSSDGGQSDQHEMNDTKEPQIFCRHDKLVDAGSLKPHPENTNQHPKAQLTVLGKVIMGNGWRNTVVVSKRSGFITKGHARHLVALEHGWRVPVEYQEYADAMAEKRDMAADNIVAELAEQDRDMLKALLTEAASLKVDPSLFGFTAKQAELMMGETNDPNEASVASLDRIKALDKRWKVKPGQLWRMGQHRLICGDSRNPEIVERLLRGGAMPNLLVTDPPYGVKYDASWRNDASQAGQPGKHGASKGTKPLPKGRAVAKVQNDHIVDWRDAYALFPGNVLYVWHAPTFGPAVDADLVACEMEIRAQIVWNKNHIVISRGAYHWKHEACLYAVRKGKSANWQGDRKQCTVWDIDMVKNDTGHSTQKPLECMARPIRNHTVEGDVVADFFTGSGTTMAACQQLKREFRGIEIDTGFCAITLQRYLDLTGDKPEVLSA